MNTLAEAVAEAPIVAILRGVRPGEVERIAGAIIDAGIGIVEVPLNSPEPIDSIARLAHAYGNRCLVGAGTVIEPQQVDAVFAAGGRLIVSPNADARVIARAVALGMDVLPGIRTATEAFAAIAAGARCLKLFPVSDTTAFEISALKSVLPVHIRLFAVGGVTAANLGHFAAAGADGFGVGSALYKAGNEPNAVEERATALMDAWARVR